MSRSFKVAAVVSSVVLAGLFIVFAGIPLIIGGTKSNRAFGTVGVSIGQTTPSTAAARPE